jgi:hypothetical protein
LDDVYFLFNSKTSIHQAEENALGQNAFGQMKIHQTEENAFVQMNICQAEENAFGQMSTLSTL